MFPKKRKRFHPLPGGFWTGLFGIFLFTSDLPAKEAAITARHAPDVFIMVFSTNLPEDLVTITYNKPVSDATAQSDASRLAADGSWALHGYTVATNRTLSVTSVSFRSSGIVVRQSGVLPLGPFLKALKRFSDFRLAFVVGRAFSLKTAWKQYQSNDLEVQLDQRPSANSATYVFDVHLRNHNFEHLTIPTQPSGTVVTDRRLLGRKATLLALMALTCGVVATGVAFAAVLAFWSRRQWRRLESASQSHASRRLL